MVKATKHPPRRLDLTAVLAIAIGVIILIWPDILAITVAIFLIIFGILRQINH